MKKKGLYIVITCYSSTRWIADVYDSDTFYYIADGCIIGLIGIFLFLNSDKSIASVVSFCLMLVLAVSQMFNESHAYLYNEYIRHLPLLVAGVTLLEVYKNRHAIIEGIKWILKKIKLIKK